MTNIKLLIVDDDKVDRLFIKRELNKIDSTIEFYEADSATNALELTSQHAFDCITMDYHLPDSNGLEALLQIEEIVPIIMITGDDSETLGLQVVKSGAQDFLQKKQLTGDKIYRSICFSIERNRILSANKDLSFRDELTKLYNRSGFSYYTKKRLKFLKLVNRINCKTQVFFINIDNLKKINDSFGPKMADRMLIHVANILMNSFRETDVISRLDRDGFAVLLTRNCSESGPDPIFERLENNVKEKNAAYETPGIKLSISNGSTIHYNMPESSLELLLLESGNKIDKSKKNDKDR